MQDAGSDGRSATQFRGTPAEEFESWYMFRACMLNTGSSYTLSLRERVAAAELFRNLLSVMSNAVVQLTMECDSW